MPGFNASAPRDNDVVNRQKIAKKWSSIFKAASKPGGLVGQKYI